MAPTALTLDTAGETLTNRGLIEATGAGGLTIASTTVNNAGGVISADAGAHVSLQNADIQGGTLETSGSGVIRANLGSNDPGWNRLGAGQSGGDRNLQWARCHTRGRHRQQRHDRHSRRQRRHEPDRRRRRRDAERRRPSESRQTPTASLPAPCRRRRLPTPTTPSPAVASWARGAWF